MFEDRADAGRRLAAALAGYAGQDVVVFGLPRGGMEVAAEVAGALNAPLDIILVRKIGAPRDPELAIGAVADGPTLSIVRNDDLIAQTQTKEPVFDAICRLECIELERRRKLYLEGRQTQDPRGRTAIVVDDGLATGATMRAALKAVRKAGPRKLVLAIPVAPRGAVRPFQKEVDDIVCLHNPKHLDSVGAHYADFRQLTDADVIRLLEQAKGASADETRRHIRL